MAKDAGFEVTTTTTATTSPIIPSIFTFSSVSTPVETFTDHIAEDKLLAQIEKNLKRTKIGRKRYESKDVLKVDGGMTGSDVMMQMQADILGIPVERPTMRESTALGAALLAGAALNLFGWDLAKPKTLARVNKAGVKLFEPSLKNEEREWKYKGWNRAVERASNWK